METLKTPKLPELPQNIHLDVPPSQSQVNVGKYIIDTPRDDELKKREKLWNYHQKNRGVNHKIKSGPSNDQEKRQSDDDGVFDGQVHHRKIELDREVDKLWKNKRGMLPSRHKSRSESSLFKKEQKEGVMTYTYSSALTIGNSIYSQLRGKEREKYEHSNNSSIDKDKKRSIVNSIDKLPDLSAALTKLGYLKLTRNVVHYGGGFFGRQGDKRYVDLRRSFSTVEADSKLDSINVIQDSTDSLLQTIDCLDSVPIKLNRSPNISSRSEGRERKSYNLQDFSTRKSDEKKTVDAKASGSDVKRNEEWRKHQESIEISAGDILESKNTQALSRTEETKLDRRFENYVTSKCEEVRMNKGRKHDRTAEGPVKTFSSISKPEVLNETNLKAKTKNRKLEKIIDEERDFGNVKFADVINESVNAKLKNRSQKQDKVSDVTPIPELDTSFETYNVTRRPSSNMSLDMPEDKFGPSSQPRDHKSPKYPWVCGLNPYRWTSKPALTQNDKPWIERALQKTDVVDQSTYDVFARTKPPKLTVMSEQSSGALKEKQTNNHARTGM